jgi:TRAP-type mannitol/chloroaromatic compound transport system substrate-binding protein
MHMVVNLERWNTLPKPYQAILTRACEAANTWMLAKYDSLNPAAVKRMVASGAVLRPFSQPVIEACFKAANEHFAEIGAKDAQFKKAYDSATTFARDQVPWWQMSEHALDAITIAMRGRAS